MEFVLDTNLASFYIGRGAVDEAACLTHEGQARNYHGLPSCFVQLRDGPFPLRTTEEVHRDLLMVQEVKAEDNTAYERTNGAFFVQSRSL